MGSFNAQCLASKMNIFSGAPMVIFPIYKARRYNSFIKHFKADGTEEEIPKSQPYSFGVGDNFEVGLPFFGQYNDYGGFELNEKQKTQVGLLRFLETIKTSALPANRKTCDTNQAEFDPLNLPTDLEECLELIHTTMWRGELFIKKEMKGIIPVHFAYISKPVYDFIIKKEKKVILDLVKNVDEHIDLLPEFVSSRDSYFQSMSKGLTQIKHREFSLLEEQNKLKVLQTGNYFLSFYKQHELKSESFLSKDQKKINRLLDENEFEYSWEKSKKQEYRSLLVELVKAYAFNDYLGFTLNISWEPIKTTGQEYSNKDIMKFQQFTQSLMKKTEKRFED